MSSIHFNVAMVSQQFSPVCWIACATMVLQFKRGYTPTAEALGQNPDFRTPGLTVQGDHAGTIEEQYNWLRHLGFIVTESSHIRDPSQRAMAPPRAGRATLQTSGPSDALILWLLRNHGPFILNHHFGAFWYGPGATIPQTPRGQPVGAHAVVITGIDTVRHRVTFNNPWGTTDVPTTSSSIVGAIRRFEAAHGLPFAYL